MIKFIYFDVGGVLIKDFSGTDKWDSLLQELNIDADVKEKFENRFSELELEMCVGRDTEEIFKILKEEFNIEVRSHYSFLDAFVNRFERNESIWSIVSDVQEKSKIGLLTNMYPKMLDRIMHRKLMDEIEWDVVVDSSIVKLAKPDEKIFKFATKQADVEPAEILFIENTQRHIDAADKAGWKTVKYDPNNVEQSNEVILSLLKNSYG